MLIATVLGAVLAYCWNWSLIACFIFGLSLSCASTVVLIRALQGIGALESEEGQVAVGWLIVEDLVTVLLLVLMPSLASVVKDGAQIVWDEEVLWTILETGVLIVGFIVSMTVVGRRVLPWILMQAVKTGSREIFTLCVVALAIGIAYASSEIFKVSFALGAFFAGMMMRESEYAHRAAQDILPLQDAFSVIFFLGVGMLFDPTIVVREPVRLLGVVGIIVLGKALVSMLLVRFLGCNWKYALTIGASLSQVGEFSFILGALGVSLGFLPQEGMTLILGGAIFSIALNPLVFKLMKLVARVMVTEQPIPEPVVWQANPKVKSKGPVVIIGANLMGRDIYEALMDKQIPCTVIEQNVNRVSQAELRKNFVLGDATQSMVLEKAGVIHASCIVLTLQDALTERKIIDETRQLNPEVKILALISKDGDRDFFTQRDGVLMPNIQFLNSRKELAKNLITYTMSYYRQS